MDIESYVIVDIRNGWRDCAHMTFWQPDNAGYTSRIDAVGRYGLATLRESPGYYQTRVGKGRFSRYAVPAETIERLAVPAPHQSAGRVIPNTAAMRRRLARARIDLPCPA